MTFSRRRNIINSVVNELKNINGSVSSYDGSYTYTTSVNNKVFRRVKFLDEVNDFPSVYLQADQEVRDYQTYEFTIGLLPIIIRCYVHSSTAQQDLENLFVDIEHVIDNFPINQYDILDITIDSISSDNGLIEPFGIGEIEISVLYEIDR